MNITKKLFIFTALLAIYITIHAFAKDASARGGGGRHHGPPPEAYTACEGKSVGDTAEFVNPHGNTVTGTCEEDGDRLVLRPDNPPGGRRENSTRD